MNELNYSVNRCGIVVLAAGNSTRLGEPKQLLRYKGESLLRRAATAAINTKMTPVVVVLGSNYNALTSETEDVKIHVVINERWQEGMASSLRCGLNAVQKIIPNTDAIIFMVCDQPYVNSSLLNDLLAQQRKTKLPIITSAYETDLGTPALFHKSLFAELMELDGDMGAKKLINRHRNLLATVPFPKGNIDIDTMEDFMALSDT